MSATLERRLRRSGEITDLGSVILPRSRLQCFSYLEVEEADGEKSCIWSYVLVCVMLETDCVRQ
jgi:hypothetical protein